jgi:hypothetical protein
MGFLSGNLYRWWPGIPHVTTRLFTRVYRTGSRSLLQPVIPILGKYLATCEPGSSVSIVSGYGLEDRETEVRFPAETKGFFSQASVSRLALGPTQPPVQWVPRVLSPGLKRGRGVTLTTHPHLVPRSRMSRSYTSSPPQASS